MADPAPENEPKKKKGILLPLLIGLGLAAAGGGGGYWAVTMGPFAATPTPVAEVEDGHDEPAMAALDRAFVPLETVIISLGSSEAGQHLIFTAELEVEPDYEAEVTRMSPRVLDILNGFLRAISLDELTDPQSLGVLRAQMLRRVQTVLGPGRVHDLLVTQFVVN